MNDLLLNWKIPRMLPKRRKAANNRGHTKEELQKLMIEEFPKKEIKYGKLDPGEH
jgi:hypothetical protein